MVTEAVFEIEALTSFALETIRDCGAEALSFYGKGQHHVKFDEQLVTEAELHLRRFFHDRIESRFPGHQVFLNNLDARDYSHEENRYLWIFDPIDGMANFQAGIPIWGVSLALLENFWPVMGAFFMPATGDLFHAMAGRSAFWGDQVIATSAQESLDDESLLMTYSRFHQRYRVKFPGKIRDLGCTGAHLCYVAMGRAEAAVVYNESYPDLAAVRVIVEAAGGKIFKVNGDEFFLNEFLDGRRIAEHLLVCGPELTDQLVESLEKID
jgi:myo-inositol-1(or 4)-monophosphatase